MAGVRGLLPENFGWVVQLFSFVIDGTITSKTFFSCGLSKIDHVINGH